MAAVGIVFVAKRVEHGLSPVAVVVVVEAVKLMTVHVVSELEPGLTVVTAVVGSQGFVGEPCSGLVAAAHAAGVHVLNVRDASLVLQGPAQVVRQ